MFSETKGSEEIEGAAALPAPLRGAGVRGAVVTTGWLRRAAEFGALAISPLPPYLALRARDVPSCRQGP